MSDEATVLHDCYNCPLFDVDLEDCKLNYNVQFKLIDGNGYHVSNDCRLLEIRTRDEVIIPAALNLSRDCDHEFFKCQVPASDSCVAIYHQVCRKCRWDKRKGIIMPPDIWRDWAVPQLEKLDFKWDTTKAGSTRSLDWREWATPPTGPSTTTAGEA